MPTVYRINGLRVVVYPNDHRPAHVHVLGAHEALFELNPPNGPVSLRENYGFSRAELTAIAKALDEKIAHLCAEWSRIHG